MGGEFYMGLILESWMENSIIIFFSIFVLLASVISMFCFFSLQGRLSLWKEKLNRFEDWDKAPLHPTTTMNTQAAARFISHSLSHLTADQKRSMQAISRGEGEGWSGKTRKPQPLPDGKSVRAAAEEFLAKAAQELSGYNDSRVKGPVRLIRDEDED